MRILVLILGGLLGLAFIGVGLVTMIFGGLCAEADLGSGITIMLIGGFLVGVGVLILWSVFKGSGSNGTNWG